MKKDNRALFEEMPVRRAVLQLAVPTVISQLITMIYNIADTFFIGQIGDPNQVAASSLTVPIFLFVTAVANLFGIGGAGVISRSLGSGDRERAGHAAAFSVWAGILTALAYGILLYSLSPVILPWIGANEGTYAYTKTYLFWTIFLGSVPSVLNPLLAHLIRSEGYSGQAGFGMTFGAVLNIAIDPIFVLVLGMEIRGAAIATFLSNLAAMAYLLFFIFRLHGNTVLQLNPKYIRVKGIAGEILITGLPSSVIGMMSTFSNLTVNQLMSGYGNEALAGVGIAKRLDVIALGIATGMSQGVLPLVAYNYASGNLARMKKAVTTELRISLEIAVTAAILLFTCSKPLVSAFIDDPLTVSYGRVFQRIICVTGPCTSVTLAIIMVFQAVGKKLPPLILSFLRKGTIDIPFMYLLNALIGINGIVTATPIADVCSMCTAILVFLPFWKKLLKTEESQKTGA